MRIRIYVRIRIGINVRVRVGLKSKLVWGLGFRNKIKGVNMKLTVNDAWLEYSFIKLTYHYD